MELATDRMSLPFGFFDLFAFHCEQTSFENKTALSLLVLPYEQ